VIRVLALDYGSARCGCAISDPTGTLATPLGVIDAPASEAGVDAVKRLVAEQGAQQVVVGLPVSLSGEDSAQTAEARRFAERLAEQLPVPVDTYDERFTTALAKRTPGRAPEDSRAAAHLLESYLVSRAR
jgi:putative Holliday junction resolvase